MNLNAVNPNSQSCVHFLYRLLEEREPGESITHAKMPTYEEHEAFVRSDPYRAWYIITDRTVMVGSCLLTKNNEIGITIAKEHRRKGYARAALVLLTKLLDPLPASASVRNGHFVANINPDNQASIKIFTGLGARHIQNTYQFD